MKQRAYSTENHFEDGEISELIQMQIEKLCDEEQMLETIKETIEPRIESIQAEVSIDSIETLHQCSLPIASSLSAVFKSIDNILDIVNSDLDALQAFQDSNEKCVETMAQSIIQVEMAQQRMTERALNMKFDAGFHTNFVQSANERIRRAESEAVEINRRILDEKTGIATVSSSLDLLNIATQKTSQHIANFEARIIEQKEKQRKKLEEFEAQRILAEITEIEQRKLDESLRRERTERDRLLVQHKRREEQLRLKNLLKSADKMMSCSKSPATKKLLGEFEKQSVKRSAAHLSVAATPELTSKPVNKGLVSQLPVRAAKSIKTETTEPVRQSTKSAILGQYEAWDNTVDSQNWDDSFFND